MIGRHLLDTNIVVALFRNEKNVRDSLVQSAGVFIPAIVIGELFYGARHSAHVDQNLNRVREFTDAAFVLDCDAATADFYGQIKNAWKEKGRPLPENDIWIAAIATQHSLTVVSRDRHFQEVDGLRLAEW